MPTVATGDPASSTRFEAALCLCGTQARWNLDGSKNLHAELCNSEEGTLEYC